jgi:hypothetical protein
MNSTVEDPIGWEAVAIANKRRRKYFQAPNMLEVREHPIE